MAVDRCTDTNPHPAHRAQYGPFGVKDCPGVRTPPVDAFPGVDAIDLRDEAITLLDAATLAPADRDYTVPSAEVIAAAQVYAILHLADVIARLTTTEETRTDG